MAPRGGKLNWPLLLLLFLNFAGYILSLFDYLGILLLPILDFGLQKDNAQMDRTSES